MEYDSRVLAAVGSALLFIVIMCLIFCLRRRKQRRNMTNPRNQPTASTNIYTVPTNYYAVSHNNSTAPAHNTGVLAPPVTSERQFGHNRISSQGDRFAVPLDLLPQTFDYNAPGVEHKGDYVLVKDLNQVQIDHKDEYQKQAPYNPNFSY